MKLVILQIKDTRNCEYAFEDYDKSKFDLMGDYEVVWCGDADFMSDRRQEIADEVFSYFQWGIGNDDQLKAIGYTGRSISVSDVISLDGHELYCECFGWRELN